jgi:hypothetical protein
MIEINADLFYANAEILLIPTNGVIKQNGDAVMGAGIAKFIDTRRNLTMFTTAAEYLGAQLKTTANIPLELGYLYQMVGGPRWSTYKQSDLNNGYRLYSFPTKNHFKDDAQLPLIARSAELFREIWLKLDKPLVAMPRLGCGCGGLNWETQVKPVLMDAFPEDQFLVYNLPKNAQH